MKRVIVASLNPVKIDAVRRGFEACFPGEVFEVEGCTAPSSVSDQPMTDEETKKGAYNRLNFIQNQFPDHDFYAAIEGGIVCHIDEMDTYAWVVIRSKNGTTGRATTARVQLPPQVANLVKHGEELGLANDNVFGQSNSKHSSGATGLLTKGLLNRDQFYEQGVLLALVPFINPDLYE